MPRLLPLLLLLACAPPGPLDPSGDAEHTGDDAVGDSDPAGDSPGTPPTDTPSDGDTGPGDTDATPVDTDATPPAPTRARRVILAGDSWSTGLVGPLRGALDAHGYADVALSWQTTAAAGSKARDWVANGYAPALGGGDDLTRPRLRDALDAELAASPPPDVLVLVLGGNDLNADIDDGLDKLPKALRVLALDRIQDDLRTLVTRARKARPELDVVLVGYTYFHAEFLRAFGLRLGSYDTRGYNEILVELERRKRDLAGSVGRVDYAHNLGLLQHLHGDTIHPPFSVPNPLTGAPEYPAGVAPAPGWAPAYDPFPGGLLSYPAPLDLVPDGIHPSAAGFRMVADHVLDQGMTHLLDGYDWLGTTVQP